MGEWKSLVKYKQKYSQLPLVGHLYKVDTLVKQTSRVGPYFSLLPLFDSLRDRHQSYKASHKGVHLRENYCTQESKCRKVLGSLRYTSQSNSSSYMFKVHNKHTLHSLPQHNLLEFLLFLYHSIPSHFLMLQLVAQLDQPLIISNNSSWVWNNIVASQMKKTFESQQSIPREHITNNLKVALKQKYLHCIATLDTMHNAVWVSS